MITTIRELRRLPKMLRGWFSESHDTENYCDVRIVYCGKWTDSVKRVTERRTITGIRVRTETKRLSSSVVGKGNWCNLERALKPKQWMIFCTEVCDIGGVCLSSDESMSDDPCHTLSVSLIE